MDPLLGILIPTLECRHHFYDRLMDCLMPQLKHGAVIFRLIDNGEETIGAKRQALLEAADTPYVAMVDDDDLLHKQYGELICEAIRRDNPDVIGFKLRHFQDNELSGIAVHSLKSAQERTRKLANGEMLYLRTPNHLNPIRREIALAIGYRPVNHGEDSDYMKRLYQKFGTRMRETFVDDPPLYDYLCRGKKARRGEKVNRDI